MRKCSAETADFLMTEIELCGLSKDLRPSFHSRISVRHPALGRNEKVTFMKKQVDISLTQDDQKLQVPTENHRRHILEEQTRSVYII
jgi:hypothetical protein